MTFNVKMKDNKCDHSNSYMMNNDTGIQYPTDRMHVLLLSHPRGLPFRLRLTVGSPKIVASNVQARAVAVDDLGNVVVSDEPTSRLLRVPGARLVGRESRGARGSHERGGGDPQPGAAAGLLGCGFTCGFTSGLKDVLL